MAAQTPRPSAIVAPTRVVTGTNFALLVRMPTTPTEERTLGARAIMIVSRGLDERIGRAAVEGALNSFDASAGTSAPERARAIIVKLRAQLGNASELCMVGMGSREAWAATTSGASAAALVLRETRRVAIPLPGGAPGAKDPSATRQGVTVGRIPISEGDRIALASTPERSLDLVRRADRANPEDEHAGVLLALLAPTAVEIGRAHV